MTTRDFFRRAPLLVRNFGGRDFDGAQIPLTDGIRRQKKREADLHRDGLLWYAPDPIWMPIIPAHISLVASYLHHPFARVTPENFPGIPRWFPTTKDSPWGKTIQFSHSNSLDDGVGHSKVWKMPNDDKIAGDGTIGHKSGGYTLYVIFKPVGAAAIDRQVFFLGKDAADGVLGNLELSYRNETGFFSLGLAIHNGSGWDDFNSADLFSEQGADGYFRFRFHFTRTELSVPGLNVYNAAGAVVWSPVIGATDPLASPTQWEWIVLGGDENAKDSQSWRGQIPHISLWTGSRSARERRMWAEDPWWFLRNGDQFRGIQRACFHADVSTQAALEADFLGAPALDGDPGQVAVLEADARAVEALDGDPSGRPILEGNVS